VYSFTKRVRLANIHAVAKSACAKNYENWLEVDKVIATISRLTFLAYLVYR